MSVVAVPSIDYDHGAPFTAVTCVLRAKAPAVDALPHIVELLDALLDETVHMTLDTAVVHGSARLVARILRRVQAALRSSDFRCRLKAEIALGEAIHAAVEHVRIDLVQQLHAVYPRPLSTRLLPTAATHGALSLLQWLLAHRSDDLCIPHPAEDDALTNGELQCCLREVYYAALNHSQHHVVRWLVERGYVATLDGAGDAAAATGDLDMVRWVHAQHRPQCFSSAALDRAASGGHVAVVHFLVEHRPEKCSITGINGAMTAHHGKIVSLLYDHDKILHGKDDLAATAVHAAAVGRLDILQAHPRGDNERWHFDFALYAAAEHGHVHVVDWITRERMVPFPAGARSRAAGHGQLAILQWAHAHSKHDVWGVDVMNAAAVHGHVDVVQWLHEHRPLDGCSPAAMNCAAGNGHLEMVQWLHLHRSEGCTSEAMNGAAGSGHLHILQWLHAHRSEGCTSDAMDEAARNGHLEVVKWLHCHRTEGCSVHAMDGAARGGFLPVLEFLHTYRREGCSWQAAVAAAINKHAHVVTWLREKYPLVYDAARVADARGWSTS